MSKKPKPRTLGAEPLEERLPVSSSAAGVLFGFSLTQNEPGVERSATPGYEAAQIFRTESIAQPTLVDLTLDLQLDALAVDLVHSEESLLDAISSPSDDPFVLTPLTPSVALSDTDDNAHRELGNELLLYQISTLEVHQVSFEPMTPHHGFAGHDFGDAMTPPEDLTTYGYSPIANDLEKDDESGGTRCGGGSFSVLRVVMPVVDVTLIKVTLLPSLFPRVAAVLPYTVQVAPLILFNLASPQRSLPECTDQKEGPARSRPPVMGQVNT